MFGKIAVVFCHLTPDRSTLPIREKVPIGTITNPCFTEKEKEKEKEQEQEQEKEKEKEIRSHFGSRL